MTENNDGKTGRDCQERLVRLLPCPFCDSAAHITDESMPDEPLSWFFARCPNWEECNCWLAGGSPEKVASKWNRRAERAMEAWRQRALKAAKDSARLEWLLSVMNKKGFDDLACGICSRDDIDEAMDRTEWPCQHMHGGRGASIMDNNTAKCDHPECNPLPNAIALAPPTLDSDLPKDVPGG